MAIVAKQESGTFEDAPEGVHPARCYRIIDLGHQNGEYQGKPKIMHKVMITWELLGEERMADGRPFSVSKRYTLSLADTSHLKPALESWRGRSFTAEELAGFDISKVLGAYCFLNIISEEGQNKKIYRNVGSIMPLPKGSAKPESVNKDQLFDINEPDMEMFESFYDKLKDTIRASTEWEERVGGKPSAPPSGSGFDDFKDDIPF